MFLLDTNVISQIVKSRPNKGAIHWLKQTDPAELRLSVVTLGEIVKGYAALRRREPDRAERLADWCAQLENEYANRILNFDAQAAHQWGEIAAAFPNIKTEDAMIASIALVNSVTLVTHNISDFVDLKLSLINPFN